MSLKKIVLLTLSLIVTTGFSQILKAQSDEQPYDLDFEYTGEVFSNLTGGIDQGVRYMDNIDITLDIDGEQVFGLPGTRVFLYGLGNQGGNLTELVGDVQTVSNIEAQNSWRFYEAWVQYISLESRTSYLVGLYDLNAEFDVNNTGSLFINSSHGIGAAFAYSGRTGPSIFPLTSVAGRLKYSPADDIILKAAVFDGVPSDPGNTRGTKIYFRENDGLLLAGELSLYGDKRDNFDEMNRTEQLRTNLNRTAGEGYKTKLALGGWYYTKDTRTFQNPLEQDNNWGAYLLAETEIFPEWDDRRQGLSGFARFGTANPDVNRFSWYVGSGIVYTGLFKGADEDRTGLAFALPLNSDEFMNAAGTPADIEYLGELNIELTHQKVINDRFKIQLDTQYIIHPNMRESLDNAWAFGLRLIGSLN